MESSIYTITSISLGIIAQSADGSFDGFLAMGWLEIPSAFSKILTRRQSPKEPDYRILGGKLGVIGAGWKKARQTSGKPFISITLEYPNVSGSKVSANTGLAKGPKDKSLAMIWNPQN